MQIADRDRVNSSPRKADWPNGAVALVRNDSIRWNEQKSQTSCHFADSFAARANELATRCDKLGDATGALDRSCLVRWLERRVALPALSIN